MKIKYDYRTTYLFKFMTINSKILMCDFIYVRRVTGITEQGIFPWRKKISSSVASVDEENYFGLFWLF